MDRTPVNTEATTYYTLPSGLRIIAQRASRGTQVEYCGLAVNAGSRDEREGKDGLAHFVEHTIFKGTDKRRSWHIINRMEAVGGELNAYTTKEETMVYSIYPTGYFERAAELIFDLATNSQFPDNELDKEREVVCDEIDSYLDQPSEAVFDDFEERIFAGSRLSHNILGTDESVKRIASADCRQFLHDNYASNNLVFFYIGNLDPEKVRKSVERYAAGLPLHVNRPERLAPSIVEPFMATRYIDSHQANTVIGARLPGMYEIDRHALALVNNILGGPGMNSRLNVSLRERRGLVYSVDASTIIYTDASLLAIYYGCDPEDNRRCYRLILNELDRLANTPLTERQLAAAKKQLIGQMLLGSDNREQMALSTARATLYHGAALTPREVEERIQAVTVDRILAIAQRLTSPSALSLTPKR